MSQGINLITARRQRNTDMLNLKQREFGNVTYDRGINILKKQSTPSRFESIINKGKEPIVTDNITQNPVILETPKPTSKPLVQTSEPAGAQFELPWESSYIGGVNSKVIQTSKIPLKERLSVPESHNYESPGHRESNKQFSNISSCAMGQCSCKKCSISGVDMRGYLLVGGIILIAALALKKD